MEGSKAEGTAPIETLKIAHPFYNDARADVTFQSSDGILFHLQRKYLEVATGAFPGAEFDTNGEITHLTESAAVLATLFGFMHPKRYPDVEELEFPLLADVAEAAEKYEAYAAIELCRLQMRTFLPKNAMEILSHGIKHDCKKLIQHAIPHLARRPLTKIAEILPNRFILAWIHYHQAFETVFDSALTSILSLKVASPNTGSRPGLSFTKSLQPQVCHACIVRMISSLEEMKLIESVVELEQVLGKQKAFLKGCISTSCQYTTAFETICNEIKEKVKEIKFRL